MISFEITKQIPDIYVDKHYICMLIRTIYLFLVYFVCLDHFNNCTPHCFFYLYRNVFRARLTFHCMSILSKIKLLYAYFETKNIERVFSSDL